MGEFSSIRLQMRNEIFTSIVYIHFLIQFVEITTNALFLHEQLSISSGNLLYISAKEIFSAIEHEI
jgi:hypothetical protein